MAKKRGRRSSSARRSGGAPDRGPRAAAASQTAATQRTTGGAPQVAEARPVSKGTDFASEYRYVLGDLKRIAILAAAMFATLLVLALVIR